MENYSERLRSALRLFDEADAYLILAGAGAAYEGGLESYGALLYEKFSDLAQKYMLTDLNEGFTLLPEHALPAFYSRYYSACIQDAPQSRLHSDLFALVKRKPHFLAQFTLDSLCEKAGFTQKNILFASGSLRYLQCPNACRELVLPFVPGAPLPRCPVCGRAFVPNLRLFGDKFVPSRQYGERLAAQARFIGRAKRLLIFELGCSANGRLGANAAIISDMLMRSNENFHVLRINKYEAFALPGLERQTLLFDEQIGKVLRDMLALRPAKRRGRPKYSPPARRADLSPQ